MGKVADALLPAKSNKGKTSNAEEVRACPQYKKYDQIANEMRDVLLRGRLVKMQNRENSVKVICPWCGTKVLPNDQGICERCCGILE